MPRKRLSLSLDLSWFFFCGNFLSRYATPFNGWGYFFIEASEQELGEVYSHFFFQASFATTSTTIVSGLWKVEPATGNNLKLLSLTVDSVSTQQLCN